MLPQLTVCLRRPAACQALSQCLADIVRQLFTMHFARALPSGQVLRSASTDELLLHQRWILHHKQNDDCNHQNDALLLLGCRSLALRASNNMLLNLTLPLRSTHRTSIEKPPLYPS